MYYTVKFTTAYKKNYKLMLKRGFDLSLLNKLVLLIANNERLDPKYCDYELSGKYKNYRECHVLPDWLLIYYVDTKNKVLSLINTGTHSDIFKK